MKNSVRRGLFHPNDIKTIGLQPPSPGPMTAPLPGLAHRRSRPSLSVMAVGSTSGPASARAHSRSSSFIGNDSFGREQARRLQKDLDKYADDEDEDYEDVFGKTNGTAAHAMQTLQLNTRLSNKSWFGDEEDEEDDPFAEIDEGYAEEDLEANLQRDKYARLSNQVTQLIDELTPSAPDFQLRDACDQLVRACGQRLRFSTRFGLTAGWCSSTLYMTRPRCSHSWFPRMECWRSWKCWNRGLRGTSRSSCCRLSTG